MSPEESILAAWGTSHRATVFLIENLPPKLWTASVPGIPRRTVRAIAAHIHNSRRSWIRTLGADRRLPVPGRVDPFRVGRRELVSALGRSSRGMIELLRLGIASGGSIPICSKYVWRNLPMDVGHVLSYFVAHEGHHRGQIVLIARQLGQRLPDPIVGGIWDWTRRAREAGKSQ